MLLSTPGIAIPALRLVVNADRPAEVSSDAFDSALALFTDLSAYSAKSKLITNLSILLLIVALISGIIQWRQNGAVIGLSIMAGAVVLVMTSTTLYGYLHSKRLRRKFEYTKDEIVFALNEVIAEPRWQADARHS